MAYVTASEFVAIPARSDGTNNRCGCLNVVCGQRVHVPACPVITCAHDVAVGDYCGGCDLESSEQYGDEFPDGYGGFGAPHCACGELVINCDGLCQYVAEPGPRDPETVAWMELPF